MILHFEIDQEVNNCRDCIFSYLDQSFGECWCKMGHGIVDGKITERLAGRAPMIDGYEEYDWDVINSVPDWCPFVKVEEDEYDHN